jgi:hypothetical protein
MRSDENASNEPDLLDAEEDLHLVVRYFEDVEERLEAQSGAPVRLVETQSARRASIAVSRFLGAERERHRAWKHSDPSKTAQEFINLVAAFLNEKGLSWEELADYLHVEPRSFAHLAHFADDEPSPSDA